jgi:hypothetical protein
MMELHARFPRTILAASRRDERMYEKNDCGPKVSSNILVACQFATWTRERGEAVGPGI